MSWALVIFSKMPKHSAHDRTRATLDSWRKPRLVLGKLRQRNISKIDLQRIRELDEVQQHVGYLTLNPCALSCGQLTTH